MGVPGNIVHQLPGRSSQSRPACRRAPTGDAGLVGESTKRLLAILRRPKNDSGSSLTWRNWKLRRTLKHWPRRLWLLVCFRHRLLVTLPTLR